MKTSGMVTRVINEVEIHCQLKHPSILEVHVLHSAGYVPLASQSPYPITVYSATNNQYRLHLGHFWANNFRDPQHSHFLFMYAPFE